MSYLEMLHREYEVFIENISRTVPVIRVSWEQYHDAEEMAEVIKQEYLQSSFLKTVNWSAY